MDTLNATLTSEIVAQTAGALRSTYVFPDVGEASAARLASHADAGGFEDAADLRDLVARISALLNEATGDQHLRLILHPDEAPDETDPDEYAAYWRSQAAETAGGIRRVERMPGNIAVVGIGPFLGLPVYAGQWQASAMAMCQGADAIILDVRDCVGGTPDGAALVCSYLFDEPAHLIDVQDANGLQQFWTLPHLPTPSLGHEIPCMVLVSSGTFSGGEELAFNLQELGRAEVVGERTRGGAHPRIGVRIHPQVELALPVAAPRSPRTGRNWEGTGVTPDIEATGEVALDVALDLLRTRLGRIDGAEMVDI